jgi:methyltransferase
VITAIAATVVFSSMIAEARVSTRHDRELRAAGAVEPPGDVYAVMRFAYPGAFLMIVAESVVRLPAGWNAASTAGVALFAIAKALKYWAIHTLGARWTFRVLVPPAQPRIVGGPYRWISHPNYVAVVGELVGTALWLGAPVAGALATVGFGSLMLRRIRIEESALAR